MVQVEGFELESEGTSVFQQGKKEQTIGNFALGSVTIRAMYNEAADSAWDVANEAFEGRTPIYVRWSPRGGATGQLQFTTDPGYVKNPIWPGGEANASPIMPEIVVETPWVTKATI
jgi:hypothetical protein